jgi:hypothetical protein
MDFQDSRFQTALVGVLRGSHQLLWSISRSEIEIFPCENWGDLIGMNLCNHPLSFWPNSTFVVHSVISDRRWNYRKWHWLGHLIPMNITLHSDRDFLSRADIDSRIESGIATIWLFESISIHMPIKKFEDWEGLMIPHLLRGWIETTNFSMDFRSSMPSKSWQIERPLSITTPRMLSGEKADPTTR